MSKFAKAVIYTQHGGPEVLRVVDREVPVPAAGQVLVRIVVSGINPTDWKNRQASSGTRTAETARGTADEPGGDPGPVRRLTRVPVGVGWPGSAGVRRPASGRASVPGGIHGRGRDCGSGAVLASPRRA